MQIEEVNTSNKANLSLAFKIEMNIPRIEYLHNLEEEKMQEIEQNHRDWNISGSMAMEKKKGLRLTYTVYYDGEDILYTVNSFHRRNILSGGLGIAMEENLITVFHNETNPIMDKFEKIVELFPDYKGLIQIETLIDGDNVHWYESIKFGVNIEWFMCLARLHVEDIELFNISEAEFKRGFGVGCIVYDFFNNRIDIDSEFIKDGLAFNADERVGDAWKGLYKNLKELNLSDLCYRSDGGKREVKTWHSLRRKELI